MLQKFQILPLKFRPHREFEMFSVRWCPKYHFHLCDVWLVCAFVCVLLNVRPRSPSRSWWNLDGHREHASDVGAVFKRATSNLPTHIEKYEHWGVQKENTTLTLSWKHVGSVREKKGLLSKLNFHFVFPCWEAIKHHSACWEKILQRAWSSHTSTFSVCQIIQKAES